jgi:hypothetical protein
MVLRAKSRVPAGVVVGTKIAKDELWFVQAYTFCTALVET